MNHEMKKIAVYCGSNLGESPDYFAAAKDLGHQLVQNNIELVYGGGAIGLMGAVADAVLEAGGRVTGVIPTFLLDKEVGHKGLTTLIETADMTIRKAKMIELADGFISMPGGLGTFEELFEVLSMSQLRLHEKPVGLLNVNGFYNPLLGILDTAIDAGFMPKSNRTLYSIHENSQSLLRAMQTYAPVHTQKWQEPTWLEASE